MVQREAQGGLDQRAFGRGQEVQFGQPGLDFRQVDLIDGDQLRLTSQPGVEQTEFAVDRCQVVGWGRGAAIYEMNQDPGAGGVTEEIVPQAAAAVGALDQSRYFG